MGTQLAMLRRQLAGPSRSLGSPHMYEERPTFGACSAVSQPQPSFRTPQVACAPGRSTTMRSPMTDGARASGRRLCQAVRYESRGPRRRALPLHRVPALERIRPRGDGRAAGGSRAARERRPALDRESRQRQQARRGFCGECGSSLFWDAPERDIISVAAGTLDGPTGLRLLAHVYVSQAGDYYDLPKDRLPRH